ncbi:transcriptional regulator [Sphingobacterium sp. SRCM116780]|uniref:transcriptional regulator n=1 Tax=Sphingobacterium sp. SRCM116780 TaxID=2907623 RepID=UPI001F39AA66|nr:transcriptional regulator [Sphingobacterium sp. SRCM116780]UIR54688.1 transcriptional regulator [Sphingobacterium sp. SRCM116780]
MLISKSFTLTFFTALLLFWSCPFAYSQQISSLEQPWIQQYSKFSYKAGNQNWGLAVHPNGFIYVANTEGLLEFDGQSWKLFPLPNKGIIRSVAIATDGKIYTGGYAEFGYWERNGIGPLSYHSLSQEQRNSTLQQDEIWKIIIQKDQILFQSFARIYRLKNKKVTTLLGNGQPFLFIHHANDKVFIEKIPDGLFELQGDQFIPVQGKELLANQHILSILPESKNSYIIATAKNGLYKYQDGIGISRWNIPANNLLSTSQVNNGVLLFNNYYAYGTILSGLIIINKQGDIIQHLNKQNGLQNNTVLSLIQDRQQQIWTGLDNGIDRIDIQSPLYYYTDVNGSLGTIYTAKVFENKLYVGTNQGLFYSDWSPDMKNNKLRFQFVPNSQGQVWDLSIINQQLICGHNDGTFRVNGNQLDKISDITGGWVLKQIPNHANLFIQANYTGISFFQKAGNGLVFKNRIKSLTKPITHLEYKGGTEFWATGFEGLQLLQFDPSYTQVVKNRLYTKTNAPGLQKNTHVFKLNQTFVFTSDLGLFRYDELSDKFQPYSFLNEKLGSFASSSKIIPAQEQNSYWFMNKGKLAYVQFQDQAKISIDTSSLRVLNHRMINDYEFVTAVAPSLYLISLDNGFALYNNKNKIPAFSKGQKPIIRELLNISQSPVAINVDKDGLIEIPFRDNNIRIHYAMPWFSSTPIEFQYYLEGHSNDWSAWTEDFQKEFTNLQPQQYTFHVRARLPNGQITEQTDLTFTILSPWYQTWWAYLLYIGLFFIALYYFQKKYQQKLKSHQNLIQRKLAEEQSKLIEQEVKENEKRIVELKNEQLEKELDNKNRELANSAMSIVYKNQLLTNIHEELMDLKDKDGQKLSSDQLRKISKIIDEAYDDDQDWNIFEKSFDEAHENFFKKLKQNHPTLVPNDLKLCAYLRMNMSSKEIASLLNITTRGVEIRRYRLRKKLNIPTEKNLTEFLLEV